MTDGDRDRFLSVEMSFTLIDQLINRFLRAAASMLENFELNGYKGKPKVYGDFYMFAALNTTLGPPTRPSAPTAYAFDPEYDLLHSFASALLQVASGHYEDPEREHTAEIARIAYKVSKVPDDPEVELTYDQLNNFLSNFLMNHQRSQFVMNIPGAKAEKFP